MLKKSSRVVLTRAAIRRTLERMAHEIVENNGGVDRLALVGVITRGDYLATRLKEIIERIEPSQKVALGRLDITLYRDDIGKPGPQPVVHRTEIPFDISDMCVVLVDDVIFTGRTTRAALDALMDFGRPRAIRLAAFLDRGHRELPIQPDHTGQTIITGPFERVKVLLEEETGKPDEVLLMHADPKWLPGDD